MILSNKGNSYKEYLNGYDLIKKKLNKQKEKALTEIERKISGLNRLQGEYYEKYVLGQWDKADFEGEKEGLYQKKSELEDIKEKKIVFFEEETSKLEEKHKYLKALLKGKTKKWDKDFVDSIIDKIFIGNDNTVEIKFNFEETPIFAEKIGGRKKRC
ncbi:MAG: hypothetical protein E6871_09930 [Streptococcus anginosus]|uniref:hypothetical protein n=1 Tax=Peptostreptococcus anaerobius TaxID=1261 RepID=UPI0028FEF070|nr:hypothetical protein [Streptococcus anginosus]MDU1664443.1 hypothetical protein [Peptoniphilus harei]